MLITWSKKFDAAHKMFSYEGKCKYLHGHTYRVSVKLEGHADKNGMVCDFNILKDIIINFYDHKTILNQADPIVECLKNTGQPVILFNGNPTAENIAKQIAVQIMGNTNAEKVEVTLCETEEQCAIFSLLQGEDVDIKWEIVNFQL